MMLTKVLAALRNPRVLHGVGVFAAALVSQPVLAAVLNGSVPLTANVLVALVLGAVAALLPKTPKA